MERKKRSKGSVWEFCYAKKKFGKFEEEMRKSYEVIIIPVYNMLNYTLALVAFPCSAL